jgi:hypothetical protein
MNISTKIAISISFAWLGCYLILCFLSDQFHNKCVVKLNTNETWNMIEV